MQPLSQRTKFPRPVRTQGFFLATIVIVLLLQVTTGRALQGEEQGTVLLPSRVGGAFDHDDERDADVYPAIAYDPGTGRYLAVWTTLRNARSSSAGFDVYGVFLDRAGQPIGSEFRISDSNTVARNGFPAVSAGDGGFAAAWTVRGSPCQISVQRVTDGASHPDRTLASGTEHRHSPSLTYDPVRRRYVLAYVAGDDYLPPTLFGAETADCGNNASSASRIEAIDFHFSGDVPIAAAPVTLSDTSGGAFRPCIAYSTDLKQYLAAWEDRRDAGGQPYRIDVYGQRLSGDMAIVGDDIAVASGADYTNDDGSATWTPRPAVVGGDHHFLIAWLTHEVEDGAALWSVEGRLAPSSGALESPFTIAQMSFAQSHAGQAPTGFLATAYLGTAREYIVGMTSHLESVWGYLSLALVQRVGSDGQLLKIDGSSQSNPGVGTSVDYDNDDQIGIGIAANPVGGVGIGEYMVAYGKHASDQTAQDFDIWGVRVRIPAPYIESVHLPLIFRTR